MKHLITAVIAAALCVSAPSGAARAADAVEPPISSASSRAHDGGAQKPGENANAGSGLILLISALIGFTLSSRRKAA